MKLSPESQITLLEMANLQRNFATSSTTTELPEQQELDELRAQQVRMRDAAAAAQMAVDDMENEILRIQSDEIKLRRRDKDAKDQLGAEIDADKRKDLEHDRYSTKSRLADLMAELQEAHNEIHALRNNRDVHGAQVDELAKKVELAIRNRDSAAEASSHIPDPELRLEQLRAQLDEVTLAEYDLQREENEVGAALFNGRACGGCFIVLPPADQSAIRLAPAADVPQCPNCGSYLVRKAV
ncbi:zinc ribbon domain-containing protein [Corynebacterium sp. A21]|uniref:zinc ribbon domain-containing protein n=1 Tax=Corynebacterium sp. A21 TaxID=3457318 RepID=UPI003FD4E6B7